MNFITAAHTDIGIRRKINQDSLLIMEAATGRGNVLLASACDGMGGLSRGEAASASMVNALVKWFTQKFPELLSRGLPEQELWNQWNELIVNTNRIIGDYSVREHTSLGTTCAAILITNSNYYIMNIGDSRIYLISDNIYQLTKDQTLVQQEIDAGRLTQEQSLRDPRQHVLLQCIGASDIVTPVFGHGKAAPNELFMLCSDGFRHRISLQEFRQAFSPSLLKTRPVMKQRMKDMTDLNIARGETDNISVILIKTC